MCDTLCKLLPAQNFFAKNSDRDYGEPQYIHYATLGDIHFDTIPEYKYEYQNTSLPILLQLKSEYSNAIPALLSRPSWLWGAEMGINMYGVAIGNEAVFSLWRAPKKGILGMDLLRLALHNAKTANDALLLLCTWIENIPQGGNGSYNSSLYYNNSFLIKDNNEAYILETAGYKYVWKRLATADAISNNYCLIHGDDSNIHKLSLNTFASPFHAYFTKGKYRRDYNRKLLESHIDTYSLMQQMQSHGDHDDIHSSMKGICLHAKGIATTTTTASWIIDYNTSVPIVWYMPHAHPCVGIYLPIPMQEDTLNNYTDCHQQLAIHLAANTVSQSYIDDYEHYKATHKHKNIEAQMKLLAEIKSSFAG